MSLSAQAKQIAVEVEAACPQLTIVYDSIPAAVETLSAVVSPSPTWGSFETSGGFCHPDVFWEVILIAPLTDFTTSMDWFHARVTELADSPTLGVKSWTQPERISLGSSGEGLAVRVSLDARTLED